MAEKITFEFKYRGELVLFGHRDPELYPDKPYFAKFAADPDYMNGCGATIDEAINEALGGGLETYTDAIADIHRLKDLFGSTSQPERRRQ